MVINKWKSDSDFRNIISKSICQSKWGTKS
jgi:hypothetical protein